MAKNCLFLIVLSLCLSGCFGTSQYQTDRTVAMEKYNTILNHLGQNDSSLLTNDESAFLNRYTQSIRKEFDFTDKKIAFFTGPSGKSLSNKKDFFSDIKKSQTRSSHENPVFTQIGGFTVIKESQKANAGGYDAILCYWCKMSNRAAQLNILSKTEPPIN